MTLFNILKTVVLGFLAVWAGLVGTRFIFNCIPRKK